MAEAISFSGLGFGYRPKQWIFRNYTATFTAGRSVAILGPNGRGKTTLLNVLLGLLPPRAGTLSVRGRAAFVPQLFQVGFSYTALDMVLMGLARKIGLFSQPTQRDRESALAALARFNMADVAEQPFTELSGGQRQLVILARALVADAQILILDEPTSALDLSNQVLILEWITRLVRDDGLTVIFTTHHPHHAAAVADDALLMKGAEDFAFGSTRDVLTEPSLEELYGVPLRRVTVDHGGRMIETFVPILAT